MKSIYINAFNKTLEEYMKMLKNTKIKEQRYIENIKQFQYKLKNLNKGFN